jgi:hypothetical protein
VARLRSEAAREWFNFEDIGMEWLETHDPIVVTTDAGHALRASDLFYGAMVLLWSLVIARSVDQDCDPASVVADVGLHLALMEPET